MSHGATDNLHTLGRWVSDRALRHPERVAIEFAGRSETYRQLDEASSRLAGVLASAGLRRADRVATVTGNRPEHVELLFACAKSATTLVPLNWRLSAAELAAQLAIVEPSLVAASQEHAAAATLACAQAGLPAPLAIEGLAESSHAAGPRQAPADGDALLIVFTSGSTGRPKGAVLTQESCFFTNLSLDGVAAVHSDDVILQVLPQYHVGGWNVQPLLGLMKGATLVLEPDFDPARALHLIEDRRVTTMMGVPVTYLMLAEQPAFEVADLSSLRTAIVGGAAMPLALLCRWQERGVAIAQGYGLTEAAPNVLCLDPQDATRHVGSAGKPYPFVEVELRDPQSGRRVEGPGAGEIRVRGPNVFAGYFRDSAATAAVLDGEGWLATGDLAERDDDGYYVIRGRSVEMFISGGENVYPAEVENALVAHRGVLEAAVVGVPHERWGETGLAFVVARAGLEPSPEQLAAHCRELLASFKVPGEIRFVAELPRTSSGKLDRRRLAAQAAAAPAAAPCASAAPVTPAAPIGSA